jgi:hypothetical protein
LTRAPLLGIGKCLGSIALQANRIDRKERQRYAPTAGNKYTQELESQTHLEEILG